MPLSPCRLPSSAWPTWTVTAEPALTFRRVLCIESGLYSPPAPVGISASSGDHFSQWAGGLVVVAGRCRWEVEVTACRVNTLVTADMRAGV